MITRSNTNLRLHQIDTKDLFGNRVLHLQARVGLDEHIRQGLRRQIDQKLEGAQAFVAQLGRHAQRILRDAFAQRLRQAGAGRNLHQLLKAALQRAFALAQRHRPFAAVAQQLNLDMACARHQALYIHTVHTKRRFCLAAAALIGGSYITSLIHRPHTAPAAAANGLDHDAAGPIGLLLGKELLGLCKRHRLGTAGHQRHAALLRQRAGSGLVAQQSQLLWRGADKAHTGGSTSQRKVCVFAQKTVAGVQRIAALLLRNLQQMCAIQIGRWAAGTQCDGGICGLHMGCLRIILRIDRKAGNAQFLQGADDAQGDFTAVGDQDFFKHRTLVLIAFSAHPSRT